MRAGRTGEGEEQAGRAGYSWLKASLWVAIGAVTQAAVVACLTAPAGAQAGEASGGRQTGVEERRSGARRGEPTERRVASEADFMLLAAQAELARDRAAAARSILLALLARFPEEPAAEEARLLLSEIEVTARRQERPREARPPGTEGAPGKTARDGARAETREAAPDVARRLLSALDQDFRLAAGDRVFFSEGSAELGAKARMVLSAQAEWLKLHPRVSVLIEGHADERGSYDHNREIAARRAEAVRARLIEEGVEANRIRVLVHGRDRPIALCGDGTCAGHNRRVVTVVLSQGGLDRSLRTGSGPAHEERR
jgi:outer membrane protein OmpA-like peptidoglycan-associated protein